MKAWDIYRHTDREVYDIDYSYLTRFFLNTWITRNTEFRVFPKTTTRVNDDNVERSI
jgi:hypothetical protein